MNLFGDEHTGELATGWIPPSERDFAQKCLTAEFDEVTPRFGDVNVGVDLPKHALLYECEKKATGSLLPRIWQKSGSCVGAGGARAYGQTMCGDIVHRQTVEEVPLLFPWATYGIGREIAGMRGRGDGSFGAAQAKAVSESGFGMLRADDQRLPQPTIRDGWAWWSAQIEKEWSWPKQWPIGRDVLAPDANNHQISYVARIKSWDELCQAFAQGYGVTCASMFGTRPRVQDGFLVGEWNDSWAHQMSWAGYYTHDSLGELVAVDNQWGPGAHPECPFLSQLGVRGSFWIRKTTVERLLSSGDAEVFAHGNSEDWPLRTIPFDEFCGFF